MSGRKAIIGLCILCSLVVSGFAAQSASAILTGTTAFTCKVPTAKEIEEGRVVGEKFSKEHCRDEAGNNDTSPTGTFRHVSFKEKTTTEIDVTNKTTGEEVSPQIFKSSQAGTEFKLTSSSLTGLGGLENLIDEAADEHKGEHYIHEHSLTLKYSGVKETLLGCKVFSVPGGVEGVIETEPLTATTTGEGHNVKIEPENAGKLFATFQLKECIIAPAPLTIKVFGDTTGKVNGATITFLHTTGTENPATLKPTMRIGNLTTGPKAGYEGTVTVSGRDKTLGETVFTPLSATTVPTP